MTPGLEEQEIRDKDSRRERKELQEENDLQATLESAAAN